MTKMTNEEIKKGLEQCVKSYDDMNCEDCPYVTRMPCRDIFCQDVLCKDAHDLIIEQEKEINQLKTECTLLDDELRNARQETINVLNELKNKCHNYYPSIDHYCCSVKAVNLNDIDEFIKELINNGENTVR